jgi:hypothetical protein
MNEHRDYHEVVRQPEYLTERSDRVEDAEVETRNENISESQEYSKLLEGVVENITKIALSASVMSDNNFIEDSDSVNFEENVMKTRPLSSVMSDHKFVGGSDSVPLHGEKSTKNGMLFSVRERLERVKFNIETFSNAIITNDLKDRKLVLVDQSKFYHLPDGILLNPLPGDFGSSEIDPSLGFQFNSQLLLTINDTSAHMFGEIKQTLAANSQQRSMFAIVAPSGSGKTHLAYAMGKHAFVTIIRIGLAKWSPASDCSFSVPWQTLYDQILGLIREKIDWVVRAERAYCLMELLVAGYYFSTVEVITCGLQHGLKLSQIKELLLRFYRNGISDEIIQNWFSLHLLQLNSLSELSKQKLFIQTLFEEIHCKRKKLTGELKTAFPEGEFPFIFAFDEIQLLLSACSGIFAQHDHYKEAKKNPEHPETLPKKHHRSLFYGLTCHCSYLLSTLSVGIVFLGTHVSITVLDKKNILSPCRANLQKIQVKTPFILDSMICLLNYYYTFPLLILDNKEVRSVLSDFRGRPYFFVEFVFTSVPRFFLNYPNTAEGFIRFLRDRKAKSVESIHQDIDSFYDNYCIKSASEGENKRILLGLLIKHVLCGNKKLLLSNKAVIEAISNKVIPIFEETVPPEM